ncbi:WYL domain-containing protein [Shewanella sp. Choline-02u-19]|jgi:predicted DNA-binding transcriptional regulator YafY|uniref:WYL domain-containing protein n=1 Tax=unclassified Shewanella TaxID=196818 RepID=UPI000C32C23B|nr:MULTISPECIES: WYL domain-containing protein [unclassified Shewanella]PKG57343.1 WYL domain-containing protein [Shewanella sp. GutDb-MelDb]PKG72662.1 WYL domain-containing protein [Shewanella sp. GutCb]PKH56958.1 WYL domain-containing protein [Shewanella sp. Bg11-22]PKI27755.1 WYL domain-containing protein [Shewanella sp. Choline-02u-19]
MDNLSHAQRQRLAFIDFSLQYFGQVSRQDLINKFATGLAAATRDFQSYKTLAPTNMRLVHQTKCYHRLPEFTALFTHEPEAILHGLAKGFGDGLSHPIKPSAVCIDAIQLIHPNTEIIAALMRAIQAKQALAIEYVSVSSGKKQREIVPHALVNNGQRWHVRAFDRANQVFTDFVVTRIKTASMSDVSAKSLETCENDQYWQQEVQLTLIPHPSLAHPEAIELDYQMVDKRLSLKCRASLAGYLLRQWSVDCSAKHQIGSGVCQLALANHEVLQQIEHLTIVPGAKS